MHDEFTDRREMWQMRNMSNGLNQTENPSFQQGRIEYGQQTAQLNKYETQYVSDYSCCLFLPVQVGVNTYSGSSTICWKHTATIKQQCQTSTDDLIKNSIEQDFAAGVRVVQSIPLSWFHQHVNQGCSQCYAGPSLALEPSDNLICVTACVVSG